MVFLFASGIAHFKSVAVRTAAEGEERDNSTDIAFIRLRYGFLHLVSNMNWYSRSRESESAWVQKLELLKHVEV